MESMKDRSNHATHWIIRRYSDDAAYAADAPYDVTQWDGNLLLNAGIAILWDLGGGTGSPTAFNAANARIGVGDSNTAAAASQTGLQASTNKTYQSMNSPYPQRSNQTQQWQAVFGSGAANYAWNEFTVDNGTTSLNRVVSAQGTKASGQTWTVTVQITLS